MHCEIPVNTQSDENIKNILDNSQTIAIIGLSPNPNKDSYKVAVYLQNNGYKIVPVYPKEDMILGEKVYRSILDIPFDIDIVDVFRKPEAVNKIYEDMKNIPSCKVLWLQLGVINNGIYEKAEKENITMIQNKCIKIEHMKGVK